MFGFNKEELKILKPLNTPKKIQDFLDKIPMNFEKKGDTCYSPRMVLKNWSAHCVEGAVLAAAILRLHGHKPLIVDMESNAKDFDHVITVFRRNGHWGAISKTNHAVLRYREPIYKTVRELVMSCFHEYFTDDGKKNLRAFSNPVNLARFDHLNWMTSEEDVWFIPEYLVDVKHNPLVNKKQISFLRKADDVEIKAGKIIEWKN